LNVLWISDIFALLRNSSGPIMKTNRPDVADVDGSKQAWINKYRAAISEPPPKPLVKRMVAGLGYVVGIILGKSKRVFTAVRPKPQPLEETIKNTKTKPGSRRQNDGESAA
jgi:hypothetical protein